MFSISYLLHFTISKCTALKAAIFFVIRPYLFTLDQECNLAGSKRES